MRSWTLESFAGSANKRKAQAESFVPRNRKTCKAKDMLVGAGTIPEGVPVIQDEIRPKTEAAPVPMHMAAVAPHTTAPTASKMAGAAPTGMLGAPLGAPLGTPLGASTASPSVLVPIGNNPAANKGTTLKWATSMGRSKKSKEVERKNAAETAEYQKMLAAQRVQDEVTQREAIAFQQTKIAQHVAEAAARILALVPSLASAVGEATKPAGAPSAMAAPTGGALTTGETPNDETADACLALPPELQDTARTAVHALAAARASGLLGATPTTPPGAADEPDLSALIDAIPTTESLAKYFGDLVRAPPSLRPLPPLSPPSSHLHRPHALFSLRSPLQPTCLPTLPCPSSPPP